MCSDQCSDKCVAMCLGMCLGMCLDMCIDMCIARLHRELSNLGEGAGVAEVADEDGKLGGAP